MRAVHFAAEQKPLKLGLVFNEDSLFGEGRTGSEDAAFMFREYTWTSKG
jgi:hypothetical protein